MAWIVFVRGVCTALHFHGVWAVPEMSVGRNSRDLLHLPTLVPFPPPLYDLGQVLAESGVLDAVTYYDSTGELVEAWEDDEVSRGTRLKIFVGCESVCMSMHVAQVRCE